MKIALYSRVSTLYQFEKGNSIEEQKRRLKAYCDSRGWTDIEYFTDAGYSGSNMDRPALQDLIARAKEFDMVLVYKLDRLGRNQRDILYLIEDVFKNFNSITENFDTSTPVGKLMLSMMGAFAELERQQINERMMMGRIASAQKGRWRGGSGVPLGYKYKVGDKFLTVDPETAPKVKEMFKLFLDGWSYNAIHNTLGCFSDAHHVRKALENPVYIGKIKYCGEYYDSQHEPLISKEIFEKAQALAKKRDIERNYPSMVEKHLLTGLLWCSCGARVCYHGSSHRINGVLHKYHYYECYTRMGHKTMGMGGKCKNRIWRVDDLEETIWNTIEELDFDDIEITPPEDHTEEYEKQIKSIEKQIAKLVELYSMDGIPTDILTSRLDALNRQKTTLLEQIATEKQNTLKMDENTVREQLSKLDTIRQASLSTQRAFLFSLIEKITLLPNHDLKIKWRF